MSKDRVPVIVSACRTAIGRFLGGLSSKSATDLGGIAVAESMKRAGIDPGDVEEVIMGQVVQAGVGQAPARQAALKGGIPATSAAVTVNKVCGSGLKAVMMAAQAIKAGDINCAVAGGMESMSNAPFLLHGARTGYKFGNQKIIDAMVTDGLWCSFGDNHMGNYAELIADKFNVTREDQDKYACESHMKAVKAIETGRFKEEIIPVEVHQRKKDSIQFDTDESPRSTTTVERLAKLKPAFQKDGTVTAGNAPGLNDGASALVVMSEAMAEENGITPLAHIVAYATGGTEPEMLFYSPVIAVRNLMEKTGQKIDDFDLIEANEAFSAQALVDGRELKWDWDRVNVNGGAVAMGHPIGASGGRVLTTLIYAMKDAGKHTGLVTLCLGGGNAVALSIEM
jgi:acetyl-CoA C-acetyltransferase